MKKTFLPLFISLVLFITPNVLAKDNYNVEYNPKATSDFDPNLNIDDLAIAVDKNLSVKTVKIFDKKVEEYKESLKKDPYSGVDFTDNFTITLKLDIKSEPREYEDYRIVGFWLRRGIDGTEKVSWSSLRKTMEDYDKEWFKSIQN